MTTDLPRYIGSERGRDGTWLLNAAIAVLIGALLLIVYLASAGPQAVTHTVVVTTVAMVGSPVVENISINVELPTRTPRPTMEPTRTPTQDPYPACDASIAMGETCRRVPMAPTRVIELTPYATATMAMCRDAVVGMLCRWDGTPEVE